MAERALSIEDGSLNTRSIITGRSVDYKDIDLTLSLKTTGDVYKKIDAAAVKQSVKNILLTNRGEKPFSPYFGSDLRSKLFDLVDLDAETEIEDSITLAIHNFEPRANVISVVPVVSPDRNLIHITVNFQIITTEETITFQTSLTRLR